MAIGNYSRGYSLSFPSSSPSWFNSITGGTVAYAAGQETLLNKMMYSDSTNQNFRKIQFKEGVIVPGQSYTIFGYSLLNGLTTEIVANAGIAPVFSVNDYWYVLSIKPSAATNSLLVGNGVGYTYWINHDGSDFTNMVTKGADTLLWTIEGSARKWSYNPFLTGIDQVAPPPFGSVADPFNLIANTTNQTTSLNFPIKIDFPLNAIRMKITTSNPAVVNGTTITWKVITKNLL